MKRSIVSFHRDADKDWVAELDCGHSQHVRHHPPFDNRPWTTTEAGRRSKLGRHLVCPNCDRFELPDGFQAYTTTGVVAGIHPLSREGVCRISRPRSRAVPDSLRPTARPSPPTPPPPYGLNIAACSASLAQAADRRRLGSRCLLRPRCGVLFLLRR